MSARRAACFAFLQMLRDPVGSNGLGIAVADSDIIPAGRPRPNCGKWFYSMHMGPRTNGLKTGDESYLTVYMTISARLQEPFDDSGRGLTDLYMGLDDRVDQVWNAVNRFQWAASPVGLMNRANNILRTDSTVPLTVYQFVEGFIPVAATEPQEVQENWFGSVSGSQRQSGQNFTGEGPPCAGYRSVMTFQGGVVLQEMDDANV